MIEELFERERERFRHIYNDIISVENLLSAWCEFLNGKRRRPDVNDFSAHLIDNILSLHFDLVSKKYVHGPYSHFKISDPKPRDIHKAQVRDRLLHHAIYRILYPYFDKYFISDSYSCRNNKGTHKAINQLRKYSRKVSRNNTRTAWILKCDIKKFFANIDNALLKEILSKYLEDKDTLWLLGQVIDSFERGLPLGNLTSQLFINTYMNEFDQFIKHRLIVKYYIRYADDFVIMHVNRSYLVNLIPKISEFLGEKLKLSLHPEKVFIRTFASGVDFLGWVHFPHHRVLRASTRRKMFRKLKKTYTQESLNSYLGLLKHGNTYKLQKMLLGSLSHL